MAGTQQNSTNLVPILSSNPYSIDYGWLIMQ